MGGSRRPEGRAIRQEMGTIVKSARGALEVDTESGRFPARRAFGCLVEPEVDDLVLLAVPFAGDLYVLSVLERPTDSPARLTSEGDLEVELPAGRFTVAAKEGLELATSSTLSLASRALSIRARVGGVLVDELSYLGDSVRAHGGALEAIFDALDTVSERWTQRTKHALRVVEETDVTRARDIDTRAEGVLSMRGKHAITTAEELVKLEGEQIHLG